MAFSKNVILTLGGRTVSTMLGITTGVITARLLGPQGKGELEAVIMWPQTLAYMFSMGMGWANVYFFAKEPDNRSKLLANSFFVSIAFGLIGVLVGEAVVPELLGRYSEHIVLLLRVFLLSIPLLLLSSLFTGVMQGCQNFILYNIVWVLPQLLYVVLLVCLLLLGRLTVERALFSWLGTHAVGLLVKLWLVSRLAHLSAVPSFSTLKRSLNYGVKSHVGDISYIVSNRLDHMFIVPILSPSDFGLYSVASRMSRMLVLIPEAMMVVLIPEASGRTDKDAVNLTLCLIQTSFFVSITLYVLLFILAPHLIVLLFGERFLGTIQPFRVLLAGSIFLGLGTVVDGGLKGLGKPIAVSYANWACIAVLIPILLFLVPLYGTTGAALGYNLGFLSRFLVLLVMFMKEGGISISELLSLKDNAVLATMRNKTTAWRVSLRPHGD